LGVDLHNPEALAEDLDRLLLSHNT